MGHLDPKNQFQHTPLSSKALSQGPHPALDPQKCPTVCTMWEVFRGDPPTTITILGKYLTSSSQGFCYLNSPYCYLNVKSWSFSSKPHTCHWPYLQLLVTKCYLAGKLVNIFCPEKLQTTGTQNKPGANKSNSQRFISFAVIKLSSWRTGTDWLAVLKSPAL